MFDFKILRNLKLCLEVRNLKFKRIVKFWLKLERSLILKRLN